MYIGSNFDGNTFEIGDDEFWARHGENVIFEMKGRFGKKKKMAVISRSDGTYRFLDLEKIKDKLEQYDKLLKDKKITKEDFDKLRKNAIDEL